MSVSLPAAVVITYLDLRLAINTASVIGSHWPQVAQEKKSAAQYVLWAVVMQCSPLSFSC